MQPVSFSTQRLSYSKRFASNAPMPQSENKPAAKPQRTIGSSLFKASKYGFLFSLIGFLVNGSFSPNFAERLHVGSVLSKPLEKPAPDPLAEHFLGAQDIQKIQQMKLYGMMAETFSHISKAGRDLDSVVNTLNESDLAFTQSLLEKYQEQPKTTETFNKLYTEWSNKVLLPRLGSEKTNQYQAEANQFFVEAQKRGSVDKALFLAFALSVPLFFSGVASMFVKQLQNKV